jgi:anionic cell wall polymer biosynthesis LytR-Cps2A-Psr (LCP) family protein
MDGETAYWYVRLRLRESDIGRSQRQRQFLWALRDRVLTTNMLPQIPLLWTTFRGSFSTDLTLVEMLDLLQLGVGLDPANVRASGITLKELQSYTTEQGASVLIINDPAAVESVVNGVWNAPAMADARRQDAMNCAPIPEGAPSVATDAPAPTPTPATPSPVAPPDGQPVDNEGEVTTPNLVAAEGG